MLDTFFGLPTHALVVHAVVVLLPLAAAGGVGVALVPWLRRRYGGLVALLTLAAVSTVPVASQSGEKLSALRSAQFGPGDDREAGLMQRHQELAEQLLPWSVLLLVGVLLVVLPPLLVRWQQAGREAARVPAGVGGRGLDGAGSTAGSTAGRPRWAVPVAVVGIVATLVGAVLTAVLVVRIGHLGSEAAWQRVIGPAAIGAPQG